MSLKVLYYVGDHIDASTKLEKGEIYTDSLPYVIRSGNKEIVLDQMTACEKTILSPCGTMIKVKNGAQTVFLLVPRLYIEKGNVFVIVNRSRTLRLLKALSAEVIE